MDHDRAEDSAEAQWVEQYKASGQGEHFERLYTRYRREVYGVCLRLLRDADAAQDATHETFLRAYRQFDSLQGNNFAGWVRRIATNLCLNRIRDEKTRRQLLESAASEQAAAAGLNRDQGMSQEEADRARRVLVGLRQEHRKVLLLRYVEGCSYPEIETLTGLDREQVRSFLQNAKRNFRKLWEEQLRSARGGRSES